MSTITCGNCKDQHESVQAVKDCYATRDAYTALATSISNPPSDAQRELIAKLLDEKDLSALKAMPNLEKIDKREATQFISWLIAQPRKQATVTAVTVASSDMPASPGALPVPAVTEGMYRMDGKVYKVQAAVHGSGNLYAKVLAGQSFQYERGAIMRLRPEHRMTLADAAEFGRLYGQCCVCGRTLTDEVSIANGIGPVCAGKGWWGAEDREALAARQR